MPILQVVHLVGFVSCLGSAVWAMSGGFFVRPDGVPLGSRVIQVASYTSAILHLAALLAPGSASDWQGIIGALLYLSSFLLFWSAIRANWQQPLSAAFS